MELCSESEWHCLHSSSVDGIVPHPPEDLQPEDKEEWEDGLRFESRVWGDRAQAFTPYFSPRLAELREQCIDWFLACFPEQVSKPLYFRTLLTLDLTLTFNPQLLAVRCQNQARLAAPAVLHAAGSRDVKEAVLQRLREAGDGTPGGEEGTVVQVGGAVSATVLHYSQKWPRGLHTSLDWLRKLARRQQYDPEGEQQQQQLLSSKERWEEAVTLLSALEASGRVSRCHPPSILAAAVLHHLFGDSAEPHLCGIDLFDVLVVKEAIEGLVSSSFTSSK